jgi:biopolymer transport protein ExbD
MAGNVGDGEFGFQIAPMLDILFVLLLFFMVSAGAQKHEASLTTQLPGGSAQPGGDIPVRIAIDEDGQVSFSDSNIDGPNDHQMPQLVERLKGVVQAHDTQPVIITPSRSTRQQRVVDVLNACAAAKVKNLAFGSATD